MVGLASGRGLDERISGVKPRIQNLSVNFSLWVAVDFMIKQGVVRLKFEKIKILFLITIRSTTTRQTKNDFSPKIRFYTAST